MNKTYFQASAADWRAALAQNQRRTYWVIGIFILIYLVIGFIVDIYIHDGFAAGRFAPVFSALISFTTPPWAAITMCIVAVISLIITYALHDRLMLLGTEYREITPKTAQNLEEQQLYNVVEELKIAAGIRYMPKIYIIDADYMNAFASGYSQKSAMIAITKGLMQKLNRSELQAVMAHELSHIRHGDIKLTLTACVLSNIMLIVVDLFFYNAIFSRRGRRGGGNRFLIIIILIRYLLPLITVLLMLFLSRTREYMADAGSVELVRDNHPLARALLKINGDYQIHEETYRAAYSQTPHEDVRREAYIFNPFESNFHPGKSLASLFSTHPSVDNRLHALGFKTKEEI